MFVERFSDEEAIALAMKFCIMTDDPVNKWNIERYMTKENMVRKDDSITFYFEVFSHEEDFVDLSDFGFINTFIWSSNEVEANKEYLKIMYRTFGKEYLDALEGSKRKPIDEEYNNKLFELQKMLNEVTETNDKEVIGD